MRQDEVGNIIWQKDIIGIYYVDLPADLTMEFLKQTVTRDNIKKISQTKISKRRNETNVFIYDSTYLKNIQSNTRVKIEPLTHGTFNQKQEVLLDITKLSNGKYYVHYLSCNLGGIFLVTIK